MNSLHGQVEVMHSNTNQLELRDRRTGLHIALELDERHIMNDGALTADAFDILRPLGLMDEVPVRDLRLLQRPLRLQLQEDLRYESLCELMNFVRLNVPFYRQNASYNFDNIARLDDLARLPILTKTELKQNFQSLLSDSADVASGLAKGSMNIARTSGTTGERIQVISDMQVDRVPPHYEEVWGINFQDEIPRTAILTTPLCSPTECHLGRTPLEDRVKFGTVLHLNSIEDLFSAPESLVRNIAEELWAFRPEILLVNPAYLLWFAREAQRLGIALPKVGLILTTYQYTSKLQKRTLEELFNAPVYNTYSATEFAGCMFGVECKNGHWHVREDHTIMEVIKDEGPSPFGQIGRAIVTAVAGRLMPLIRYDVGDLVRLVDIDCDCPLSDWQCFEFHGRASDTLLYQDQIISTKQMDDVISEFDGIDFYRCTQNSNSSLAIEVIPSPGRNAAEHEIIDRIRTAFPIEQVSVQMISRLEQEASMKFRLTARSPLIHQNRSQL